MGKRLIPPEKGQVEEVALRGALEERYLAYALSTIMNRALPDARDGLKPVHRRILYGMQILRLDPKSAFKKSAKVVGDVMGNFHPHGDQAIYDALVRLAQDFAQRYPLVDGQGNFGNIDGDNAAAMRYTEARLTEVARLLIDGIDEDAVDQQTRDFGEPCLGVAHGGGVIAVDIAEIALPVDLRIALGEILRQPIQRVVDRLVAVRMEIAHHVADYLGRFLDRRFGVQPQNLHAVEDAAVHRLEPVARVGQRAIHDGGERIGEIALFQRPAQRDLFDLALLGGNQSFAHN